MSVSVITVSLLPIQSRLQLMLSVIGGGVKNIKVIYRQLFSLDGELRSLPLNTRFRIASLVSSKATARRTEVVLTNAATLESITRFASGEQVHPNSRC
jgi:hypothetical protein